MEATEFEGAEGFAAIGLFSDPLLPLLDSSRRVRNVSRTGWWVAKRGFDTRDDAFKGMIVCRCAVVVHVLDCSVEAPWITRILLDETRPRVRAEPLRSREGDQSVPRRHPV